jgi:CBS-domain-containing membrane protein
MSNTENMEKTDTDNTDDADKTIRDIMTPDPVGVYFDQTIRETARIMRDAQVGAVLVVSGESLTGVVTDRDLVVRGLAAGISPDDPVGSICSPKLVGVAADADVAHAKQLIIENAVRRLPVIDAEGQIVGMVSMGDLAVFADCDSPLAAVSRAQPNV